MKMTDLAWWIKQLRHANSRKLQAVEGRGSAFGVLVDKDYHAKEYQRYEKLCEYIERRIILNFGRL